MAKEKSRAQKKFEVVMREFSADTLRSSSGMLVKNKSQALAIALSLARKIDPSFSIGRKKKLTFSEAIA